MNPSLVFYAVLALVLGVFLLKAYTDVDDEFVERWAGEHGLALTPGNRPMVGWYLHTARVLRTWGAIGGFLLPPIIGAAFGSQALEDLLFPLVFVGYLVGALYAELALVHRPGDGRRVAALTPRELHDYLPRRLLVAQRALAGLVLAVGALALLLSYHRDQNAGLSGSPRLSAAFSAVVALGLAVALERLERWVVQRPQPFTAPDLVAADDAIRSQSVHSLAGSGLAILMVCLAGELSALSRSDVQFFRWTMSVVAFATLLGSLSVCQYYGHRPWRVRRGGGAARPAAA